MGDYTEYIYHVVLIATKKVILASRFLPIFVNEVTIVGFQCIVMWWQVGDGSLFCSHLNVWLKVGLLLI
jgi:hypothetical protein